ncbi:hypothetical protein NIE88_07595 [Sporolactobacillus shoreicorticis]|uniref:Uncharacterized protein n=1 Tax=Sporolactobacillus shoreicorticis TaxID=1923877 RepID=A0ABW5S6B8_9BACL|nr:hypothetical protein [Sporolactobacillus shoreicorticis]MCO7125631.1 hypothetical protein [Sporolactobacillus shoreicorticis]
MNIRVASVIQFLEGSKSSWYLCNRILILDAKEQYQTGDSVMIDGKKYKVIEDLSVLRITPTEK